MVCLGCGSFSWAFLRNGRLGELYRQSCLLACWRAGWPPLGMHKCVQVGNVQDYLSTWCLTTYLPASSMPPCAIPSLLLAAFSFVPIGFPFPHPPPPQRSIRCIRALPRTGPSKYIPQPPHMPCPVLFPSIPFPSRLPFLHSSINTSKRYIYKRSCDGPTGKYNDSVHTNNSRYKDKG